jgi:hypothetical protein
MITVTFLPILISGIASVIIGAAWYSRFLFGRAWQRLANFTPEELESNRRRMPYMSLIAFLMSMLMAYVATFFAVAWNVFDWLSAVELGFWLWVGFIVPPMLGLVLWDRRPFVLFLIHVAYWLVALVVTALIVTYGEASAFATSPVPAEYQPTYYAE